MVAHRRKFVACQSADTWTEQFAKGPSVLQPIRTVKGPEQDDHHHAVNMANSETGDTGDAGRQVVAYFKPRFACMFFLYASTPG